MTQMNLFTEQKQSRKLGEQTNGYPGKAVEEETGSLGWTCTLCCI